MSSFGPDLQTTGNVQLLVFCLDDRLQALYLSQVLRVIRAVDATPLPHAPDVVLGVIDIQGEIVPLLNTRKRFRIVDKEISPDDHFIIAKTPRRTVALFVDSVKGVIERPAGNIVAAQDIFHGLAQTQGVIQLDDGLTLIHDLDRFLSTEEEDTIAQALTEGPIYENSSS